MKSEAERIAQEEGEESKKYISLKKQADDAKIAYETKLQDAVDKKEKQEQENFEQEKATAQSDVSTDNKDKDGVSLNAATDYQDETKNVGAKIRF